ncbi:hypothetical protein GBAR_LOCUS16914 [Geodia barretti]|uniref:Uncharacterized protein n=1 Tax=Geodia barretti TaxID=519541 RepID=A0AA35SJG5_GEOBA|nr:hypothetical protein GBAR_LOCUS16914 [Geodia barretti]
MLADADDGLSLDTVHVYVPKAVTVRVWVYCAVTGSFNTVSVPWVTVVESLVQVTVVAGPPVEIQSYTIREKPLSTMRTIYILQQVPRSV